MRFIPKKKELKEAGVNPLNANNPDLSHDEAYRQAILGAIAAETAAYSEYDQILSLGEKVSNSKLKEAFQDMIKDIRDEEMKHLGQLTSKLDEIPEMKAAYETGEKEAETGEEQSIEKSSEEKEEVKESVNLTESTLLTEKVQPNRSYEGSDIAEILSDVWKLDDDDYYKLLDFFGNEELTAEEVDENLTRLTQTYQISPEMLERAENAIINSSDPVENRKEDFANDIAFDISTLENIKDNLYSVAAKNKIDGAIEYLQSLEYTGEKDVGWRDEHSIFGGTRPTKKMLY